MVMIPIVMLFGAAAFAAYWTAKYISETQSLEEDKRVLSPHMASKVARQLLPVMRVNNAQPYIKPEYIEFRESY